MASTVELRKEDQAALEELQKEVTKMMSVQNEGGKVHGGIFNATGKDLHLNYIQASSGFWVNDGPSQYLNKRSTTLFTHQGTAPDGSKVGIKYTTPTQDLEWVVAWYLPLSSPDQHKVYYGSGKKGQVPRWDEIEKILDGKSQPTPGFSFVCRSTNGNNASLTAVLFPTM